MPRAIRNDRRLLACRIARIAGSSPASARRASSPSLVKADRGLASEDMGAFLRVSDFGCDFREKVPQESLAPTRPGLLLGWFCRYGPSSSPVLSLVGILRASSIFTIVGRLGAGAAVAGGILALVR